jgi:DNA-binding transcriptional ArsR family regulator
MKDDNRRILALLSHPVRIRMIELLAKRALGTGEIAKGVKIGRPGAVVHLNHLVNEKLIHSRRYGKRVRYWLNRERLAEAVADLGQSAGFKVTRDRSHKQLIPDKPPPPLPKKKAERTKRKKAHNRNS